MNDQIRNLEMRIARLEKRANIALDLKDIHVKITTDWDLQVRGRGMGANHVYYDGKLKSWAQLSKDLEKILLLTREFQSEKEGNPESSYRYPSSRKLPFDSNAWVSIYLESVDNRYSDTKVFVVLKHKGKVLNSDDNFRVWSDFTRSVEVAVNRIR